MTVLLSSIDRKVIACLATHTQQPTKIAIKSNATKSCVSRHLRSMYEKNWVSFRREGNRRLYNLTDKGEKVLSFLKEFDDNFSDLMHSVSD